MDRASHPLLDGPRQPDGGLAEARSDARFFRDPTVFAALQWLRQKPKPRHRIRFDEWPLLLVRVALVALVGVLLAKPVLFGAASHAPYVAVAPGVDVSQAKRVAVAKDARWHWLAPGFPALTATPADLSSPESPSTHMLIPNFAIV